MRMLITVAVARRTATAISRRGALSWVAVLLFTGTERHLLPGWFVRGRLLTLPLHDTISRSQKLLDVCDAAPAVEMLQ